LGGSDPDDKIVLALSTACRHPAIALAIGATNFPEEQLAPIIVLYLLVNTLVGAAYVVWQRRHVDGAVAMA
jgi:BASS family bile acid:Na+ symporter